MKMAVVVLSQNGLQLARAIREAREDEVVILAPTCVVSACGEGRDSANSSLPPIEDRIFATDEPGVFGWVGPLRSVFPRIWEEHHAIVAVMALGIVVRLASPLLGDKRRDPAVMVVDEAGRFVVSVLGGHGAGANELTHELAGVIGAMAVITTASDSQRLPAVDQIGQELGWTIERAENLTRVAAAVIRGERIAVWQDAGTPDWWQRFGPWPTHFTRLQSWSELASLDPRGVLVISDQIEPKDLPNKYTLVYRPPTLVAGVGCRRGTPRETIAGWVDKIFQAKGLAPQSLSAIATVTLKADEPGLLEFASERGVPLVAFPPEQLAEQPGIETPSARVLSKIGIPAVAEPAALRAAGATRLVVTKQKGPGVTLAVARRSGCC